MYRHVSYCKRDPIEIVSNAGGPYDVGDIFFTQMWDKKTGITFLSSQILDRRTVHN